MITSLNLKLGSSEGQPALKIETPPSVTIFVGPNNAGKSVTLREIGQYCSGQTNLPRLVIEEIIFSITEMETAQKDLAHFRVTPGVNESVGKGNSLIKVGNSTRIQVNDEQYLNFRVHPNNNVNQYASMHLSYFVLNLDGPSRVGLINQQAQADLKDPTTAFARILTDNAKRKTLQKTILNALGMHFAIDLTEGGQLHVRFGYSPPPDERNLNDALIDYMKNARSIDKVSDGVKAFTGILLQLNTGDPKIIIIDEPEAFLHPSLASNLGKELANGAVNEGKHVFAASHSPNFVMGAILSGAKVNIVRLTHADGVGTARLLPNDELKRLMQDPLLRSVGVLEALFYDHVVVGEADADRAFYQEINERLLSADDPRGIPHTLFLNAQGKDTIPKIVEPLRKLGIPTAAIADIDIFKEGGTKWTQHLKACGIPMGEHQPYGTRRANTLAKLKSTNSDFKKDGGISILTGQEREAAENLCDELQRYGHFIVRNGEVETWLTELDVPRGKGKWLRSIFEKMGSDPNDANYVKPVAGDVWDFIGRLKNWLVAPDRKGIPD